MTTENHYPITDEEIRLYLCDALPPERRAEIRRWFALKKDNSIYPKSLMKMLPVF